MSRNNQESVSKIPGLDGVSGKSAGYINLYQQQEDRSLDAKDKQQPVHPALEALAPTTIAKSRPGVAGLQTDVSTPNPASSVDLGRITSTTAQASYFSDKSIDPSRSLYNINKDDFSQRLKELEKISVSISPEGLENFRSVSLPIIGVMQGTTEETRRHANESYSAILSEETITAVVSKDSKACASYLRLGCRSMLENIQKNERYHCLFIVLLAKEIVKLRQAACASDEHLPFYKEVEEYLVQDAPPASRPAWEASLQIASAPEQATSILRDNEQPLLSAVEHILSPEFVAAELSLIAARAIELRQQLEASKKTETSTKSIRAPEVAPSAEFKQKYTYMALLALAKSWFDLISERDDKAIRQKETERVYEQKRLQEKRILIQKLDDAIKEFNILKGLLFVATDPLYAVASGKLGELDRARAAVASSLAGSVTSPSTPIPAA